MNILIVEDDLSVRETLEDALQSKGKISVASTAKAAIDKIQRGKFDLVVTDFCLSGKGDGLDVAYTIRKKSPLSGVVFYSGQLDKQTAIKVCNLGLSYTLEKPFKLDDLYLAVDNIRSRRDVLKAAMMKAAAKFVSDCA